jgi:hypothetical protein
MTFLMLIGRAASCGIRQHGTSTSQHGVAPTSPRRHFFWRAGSQWKNSQQRIIGRCVFLALDFVF